MFEYLMPGLILADIHLADNSSGVEAVNEILAQFGAIPVIVGGRGERDLQLDLGRGLVAHADPARAGGGVHRRRGLHVEVRDAGRERGRVHLSVADQRRRPSADEPQTWR